MPYPIFDFGNVFADFCDVVFVFYEQVVHLLEERAARIAQLRQDGDRRFYEVEAVDLILHAHVERRRDRAFFRVTEHVQVFIMARVGKFMNEGRIAVEVEDDGLVLGEDRVVVGVGKTVGVYAVRLKFHQVDDVDETDLEPGQIVTQNGGRRERFERRRVAAAGDDDVGFFTLVVGSPIPDAHALRAMLNCLIHGQPLEAGVFGRDDDVDVVLALHAVVEAGEQAVCIGREIHTHDVRLFVCDVIEESRILMSKAVVVLLPDVGGENEVQRRNVLPPRELVANFEPFRVLCRHGIDHADERFVGSEETVASREDIAFQPAFAHMLGQVRVHDAAVFREFVVGGPDVRVKVAVGHFERAVEAVGHTFVRSERAEVFALFVEFEYVAHISAEFEHILRAYRAGSGDVDSIFFEIGQAQIAQEFAAVCVRVRADPVIAFGSEGAQFRFEPVIFVEQLVGLVAHEPVFEQLHMLGFFHRDGDLMGAEAVFDLQTVHDLRARPALRRAQNDHRPERALRLALFACAFLDLLDLFDALVEGEGHLFVHIHRVVAFNEVRLPAAAVEEAFHFVVRNTREDGRIVDLVTVEVQDGEHRAVACGVEEFIGMPCGRKRTRFRFAVSDGDRRDQVGVVEHRAECVGNGVTELAAFVDGTGRFGRNVAGNAAGEGELLAKFLHPFIVLTDVGIHFAVRSFQVGVGDEEVAAVAGAGE